MTATAGTRNGRAQGLLRRVTRWATWAALLFGVMLAAACAERSDCERACRRVALCKREAQQGKLILGEKAPPADQACMHKCATRPDDFAKCEAVKRTCAAMRDCYGSYRD